MATVTRSFPFDYGHRVIGHEGKCRHLHGHRGVGEVTVFHDNQILDHLQRVVDFGVLKESIGTWIDFYWDHNMILSHRDPLLQACDLLRQQLKWKDPWAMFDGKAPYILEPDDGNPTAETLAKVLFHQSQRIIHSQEKLQGLAVYHVRIWETPTCAADYTREDYVRDEEKSMKKVTQSR